MNFMDVLKRRRAVREYTQRPVERNEIVALINAAVEAPSAMNLQPWAFAVVSDRDQIDSYAKRAKEWLLSNLAQLPDGQARKLQERTRENPDFTLFYHAPALVLILAQSADPQAIQDCCLAAQSFMLAARDRGLGTCWIGFARPWLNLPEIKSELEIPQQYQVVAPIVLGHPVAWPESHGRRPAEIHWVKPVQVEKLSLVSV